MTVQPVRLARDAAGVAVSELYGDVYASRDGALGQARHVFLAGNDLPARWSGRDQFVVLETGFGLGTNFLATWDAWQRDLHRPQRLHFVSVERHPLPAADLLVAAPPELAALARQLADAWPPSWPGLHVLEFERGAVRLTIGLGDARDIVPQLMLGADAIFLDGFAPSRNPAMWEARLLKAVGRCARPGATLATYTTARAVCESLQAAGFDIELRGGYGHKRQMLVARYAPRWRVRRHEAPTAWAGSRTAAVVGAGLAGSACADALARRGWSVEVIDATREPCGASALPWGLMHPTFAVDDSVLARLTRASAAYADTALRHIADGGAEPVSIRDGFFQQAAHDDEGERWRAALERRPLPLEHVRWVEAADAARFLGVAPVRSGLWWPDGRLVSPPRWIAAMLRQPGIRRLTAAVGAVERADEGWRVVGVDGRPLATSSVVVVAAAEASPRLLGAGQLPVQLVPGQVTLFKAAALDALRAGLGGDGTLLRSPGGVCAVGATYEWGSEGQADERSAHRGNLERLARLVPFPVDAQVVGRFAGTRSVAPDRMPYVGAVADEAAGLAARHELRGAHLDDVPRRSGLHAVFAFGSRGLTYAALAADVVAARIEGEPLPIERDLAHAIDPARVLLRRLRASSSATCSDPAR